MTSNIKVDDASLDQVARSCRQAFQQTEQELGHKQQELSNLVNTAMQQVSRAQTLVSQAQSAVTKWEGEVAKAQRALRACRSTPSDRNGNAPSCSSEEAALARAQAMLTQARQVLQQARQVFEAVKQQADQLRRQQDAFGQAVSNFHNSASQTVSQAETETKRMRTHLADYMASQNMGRAAGSSGSGSGPSLNAGSAATAAMAGLAGMMGIGAGLTKLGFKNVQISDIKLARTDINGPQDFSKNFTYDQACECMHRYQNEVRPLIEQGYSLDQIEQVDYQRGMSPTDLNSLSNTYRTFFGNDAIALDSNYNLLNGQHRVFVAQQLGYNYLPVKFA